MAETYYTKKIEMPATKRDGLANFVQIIINNIEAGDARNALLAAVDLHQDIETGMYDDAMVDAKAVNAAHNAAVAELNAKIQAAYEKGRADGIDAEKARMAAALGLVVA